VSKTFNLTLLPLYRLHGNEMPLPPGLLALTPPRRKARSRARDLLIVHLSMGGNAPFSSANYHQMTSRAAEEFYKTPGSVTAALRAAAIILNGDLLERNIAASGQGRYSLANLVLCALREEQLYILESGPAHLYWMEGNERKDIHDEEMSGRGLGLGQSTQFYLSRLPIRAGGRLLISPKLPAGWEKILQRDNRSASLETIRSVLMRQSMEDHNALLIEIESGRGEVTLLKPPRPLKPTLASISQKIAEEPRLESHQPQPIVAATRKEAPAATPSLDNESKPPQERPLVLREEEVVEEEIFASPPREIPESVLNPKEEEISTPPPLQTLEPEEDILDSLPQQIPTEEDLFASIPRQAPEPIVEAQEVEEEFEEEVDTGPPMGEIIARQSALTLAKGMQATREGNSRLKDFMRKMMPRLLPADDPNAPVTLPSWVMLLIAVIIPLVVVTIASVVYFRFGRDIQYETAFTEVQVAHARAIEQSDPVAGRIAWEETLKKLDIAEGYDKTPESKVLRIEAQSHLDSLLGILRLDFQPAVKDLPRGIEIKAMAATETELFILDSVNGEILRAFLVSGGYQYDDNFICRSGEYSGKSVGALVELTTLPKGNAMGTSVLGIDAQGNLLYCAANQVPTAMALQTPPVDFKEITAIALDADILYLLDAPTREVWVYSGRAGTFLDYPTSFFKQAPQGMDRAVDLSVKGNDLYLLFADGHLASCTYSLLDTVPTRCTNPAELVDPHPAAGGGNNFGQVHFTEMHLSTPPDSALLLLAPETQAIFRFSPRSFSLQNQLQSIQGSIPEGKLSTMASNPGHLLFIAQGDKIYMVADIP